jgi:hypothetical protein
LIESILPFLGSLSIPLGPHPQVDPNSRRPTRSPVKELKQCHFNHTLVTFVVCKLYQWKEVFLVYPSISGSYVVLKINCVPKASWKLVQNHPVNIDPRSDMIFLGTPCNLTISLKNTLAMSGA